MSYSDMWGKIIRIFNGCDVRIENSVTRVTVRHHEACRTTIIDSFSCILFLRRLYLSSDVRCFKTRANTDVRCFVSFTLK